MRKKIGKLKTDWPLVSVPVYVVDNLENGHVAEWDDGWIWPFAILFRPGHIKCKPGIEKDPRVMMHELQHANDDLNPRTRWKQVRMMRVRQRYWSEMRAHARGLLYTLPKNRRILINWAVTRLHGIAVVDENKIRKDLEDTAAEYGYDLNISYLTEVPWKEKK